MRERHREDYRKNQLLPPEGFHRTEIEVPTGAVWRPPIRAFLILCLEGVFLCGIQITDCLLGICLDSLLR